MAARFRFPLHLIALLCGFTAACGGAHAAPNVLFIAIDDLRNDLGALGNERARTPKMDAFARTARAFSHHYVQVPTCGASRCTLLRGRYPETAAQLGNGAIASTQSQWGDANLPAWFQRHGYKTYAMGKITHYPGGRTGKLWAEGPEELPGSWDRCWIPQTPWGAPQHLMHGTANGKPRVPGVTLPLESFDGPDHSYPDAFVADEAERMLMGLATSQSPWFLAVGFFKPHLPFACPKSYFDLQGMAPFPAPGEAAAAKPSWPSTWHKSGEFHGNYARLATDGTDLFPEVAAEVRRAYAACVSYVDAQVGRVLTTLEKLHLDDNTIVVIWSDHGFLLGEHNIWGKHCLFEKALVSPLLIRHPKMNAPGVTTKAVVETVDLFPTLTDLCGLPAPKGLDGRSLRPQMESPAAPSSKPARAWWTQGWRTLRDDRWRISSRPGIKEQPAAVELFDYQTDPDETRNLAGEHPEVVSRLMARLHELPPIPVAAGTKPSGE
jgi:iduronate 2-sulfatase